jgi:NitT/TauT family transport system substrate-binding protein
MKKKLIVSILSILVIALAASMLVACSGTQEKKLSFAYQYGIQYLPAKIVKDQGLIEKHYGKPVTVDWLQMGSGAEINEGIIAGSIDAGFMGTSVAITGVAKGVPYKVFTGLSNLPSRAITNKTAIKSLSDIKASDKIALVNPGSIQHIILAMAAKKELGDAHALDNNIVGMTHPEGMQALIGKQVAAQVTTLPYSMDELAMSDTHEIKQVAGDFVKDATIILGVAGEKMVGDTELFDAVNRAFEEAFTYVNDPANLDQIAESMAQEEGKTKEEMLAYLKSPDVKYDQTVTGLMEIREFMQTEGFIEGESPADAASYFYEGVKNQG